MIYSEVKDYLYSEKVNVYNLTTDRLKKVLCLLGNPEKNLKVIHVVGTNGKGSVSGFLSLMLRFNGVKVGSFNSPFFYEPYDMIKVQGEIIPEELFCAYSEKLINLLEENDVLLTQFEFVAIISVLYFNDSNCEYCVYEAGLGGKNDATDIFPASVLNIITTMDLDHTEYLGNSVFEIVTNKLGIAKQGELLVSSDILACNENGKIVDEVANNYNLNIYNKKFNLNEIYNDAVYSEYGISFKVFDEDFSISFYSRYQIINMITAYVGYCALAEKYSVSFDIFKTKQAISSFKIDNRMEIVSKSPLCIADGGHNPSCANALFGSIIANPVLNTKKWVLVMGVMADKDYKQMIETLRPIASKVICVDDFNKRALKSNILMNEWESVGVEAIDAKTTEIANLILRENRNIWSDYSILYTGTLYLAENFKKSFNIAFNEDVINDYNYAVNRLTSKDFYSTGYSLSLTKSILELFSNPEDKLNCVHVAGTNGKGSVCKMTADILREAGLNVGLFTSPYIFEFGERIQINNELIDEHYLALLTNTVLKAQESLNININQFALVTIIAYLYFYLKKVDICIIETGLGGDMDPTNVLISPLCCAITNIGLDHTAVLGNTISLIAEKKAGIIKTYVPIVVYPSDEKAVEIFEKTANDKNARFIKVSKENFDCIESNTSNTSFLYKNKKYSTGLIGDYQAYNSGVVLEIINVLKNHFDISDTDIDNGLRKVTWPGRLQLVSDTPKVYVDGGHNPQCIEATISFMSKIYKKDELLIIAGFMKDKDYKTMINTLINSGFSLNLVPVDVPRSLTSLELKKYTVENKINCNVYDNLSECCKNIVRENSGKAILILGSIYQIKEVFHIFAN